MNTASTAPSSSGAGDPTTAPCSTPWRGIRTGSSRSPRSRPNAGHTAPSGRPTHPNLHYELSARTWPRHPRSAEYTLLEDGSRVSPGWLALAESMPQRFLVGSDASHHSEASERMKLESVRNFLSQLSPRARAEVGSGTLRRLIND
jgi:hypothetical protein